MTSGAPVPGPEVPVVGAAAASDRAAAWTWCFEDAAGLDLVAAGSVQESPAFARRFDAEVWLGARWRGLARAGVARAGLRRAGGPVGAPLVLPLERL